MRTTEDLASLHGVGPQLKERLAGLGILAVHDLLFQLPLRYEDRTRLHAMGALPPGMTVQVEGLVEHATIVRGRRAMLVVIISDGTGRITLRFFHFRAQQLQQLGRGTLLRCFGDVRAGYQGLEMIHPSYTRLAQGQSTALADRLTPVYPGSEGIGQHLWLKLTDQALQRLRSGELELEELLPPTLLENLGFIPGCRPGPDPPPTAVGGRGPF